MALNPSNGSNLEQLALNGLIHRVRKKTNSILYITFRQIQMHRCGFRGQDRESLAKLPIHPLSASSQNIMCAMLHHNIHTDQVQESRWTQ